jgi:hypothetical protein
VIEGKVERNFQSYINGPEKVVIVFERLGVKVNVDIPELTFTHSKRESSTTQAPRGEYNSNHRTGPMEANRTSQSPKIDSIIRYRMVLSSCSLDELDRDA